MPRKKKETLVHLDLETLSKETGTKKVKVSETVDASLGGILRQAREKKKLSTAQIAKKLCIKEIYLDALEQGHYYVFPGLAYGIGFLRTYAQFLDLDANEMVEKFHADTSSIKVEPMEMPIPQNANLIPSGRTIFKGLAALITLYLVWYIGVSLTQENGPIAEEPVAVIAEEQEVTENGIAEEITTQEGTPQEQTPKTDENTAEVKSDEPVAENQDAPSIQPAPIVADTITKTTVPVQMKKAGFGSKLWSKLTPAKVYGTEKIGALSFVAAEEVWVKIMNDDKVVFEEVLYKGDRYNVPANTSYTLTTANAGALTVYVNGKKKKPLGTKGTLAENIVLNPQNFN